MFKRILLIGAAITAIKSQCVFGADGSDLEESSRLVPKVKMPVIPAHIAECNKLKLVIREIQNHRKLIEKLDTTLKYYESIKESHEDALRDLNEEYNSIVYAPCRVMFKGNAPFAEEPETDKKD